MRPRKVLLVDDHALFRKGVRETIEPEEDFEVVGEAEDGAEALAKAQELKPELILMDINMPHGNGLEAVSVIKREWPGMRIIMLTVHDEDENLFEAISSSPAARNFTLGQAQDTYHVRLRTSISDDPDADNRLVANISGDLAHLVYTRDASGKARFYLNGEEVDTHRFIFPEAQNGLSTA